MMPKPFLCVSFSIAKALTKSFLRSAFKNEILLDFFIGSLTAFSTLPPPMTRPFAMSTKGSSNFKNISRSNLNVANIPPSFSLRTSAFAGAAFAPTQNVTLSPCVSSRAKTIASISRNPLKKPFLLSSWPFFRSFSSIPVKFSATRLLTPARSTKASWLCTLRTCASLPAS